jgi:hypothetical protein
MSSIKLLHKYSSSSSVASLKKAIHTAKRKNSSISNELGYAKALTEEAVFIGGKECKIHRLFFENFEG